MQQLSRAKETLQIPCLHTFYIICLRRGGGKIFHSTVYIYVLVDQGPHNYSSIFISYFHLSSKDSTSKPCTISILTKTQSGDTLLLQIHDQWTKSPLKYRQMLCEVAHCTGRVSASFISHAEMTRRYVACTTYLILAGLQLCSLGETNLGTEKVIGGKGDHEIIIDTLYITGIWNLHKVI